MQAEIISTPNFQRERERDLYFGIWIIKLHPLPITW